MADLKTIAHLVTAADGDTLHRDVYLRRATELLSPLMSETSYAATVTARERLERLMAQARGAVAQRNWQDVRELGASAAGLQRSLAAEQETVATAESVYDVPPVIADPLSPGLKSKRWSSPAQARAEVIGALAELAREDPGSRELYLARQRALEALKLPGAAAGDSKAAPVPGANLEQQALQALERGDAAALQELAESMVGRPAAGAAADEPGTAARGSLVVPPVLGEPLPAACAPRAKALGLEAVEAKLASEKVSAAISGFVERYALGASQAVHDRSQDGVARVKLAAEDFTVPPELSATFADTISLMALHLFVNSAGVRYVPLPVAREALLVEPHAEGEDPVTPLLRELGLDRRRALSRDEIEVRLQKNGARVIAEHLGLDPIAFRLVCVPADVYVRLGRERGWGQRPEWTHFDGYQIAKGGRLRALVGGNAKFGGLFDLCSIASDDARDNTVARFAVIRRERLGVRIG
jgi:hypothetical protein